MSIPIVESLLKVIDGGIKYLTLLQKTSHIRRMRRAVDYGETYILDDMALEKEEDLKKRIQIRARKKRAKKLFFRFNQ